MSFESGRTPAAAIAARKPSSRSELAIQVGGPVIAAMRRCPSESRCSVAARAPVAWPAEIAGIPSSSGIRGSTTTNGRPWRFSAFSSLFVSSGSVSTAPSVVPCISRSSSVTSRSCWCRVGQRTIRMSCS